MLTRLGPTLWGHSIPSGILGGFFHVIKKKGLMAKIENLYMLVN